jgi:exostosin family protein
VAALIDGENGDLLWRSALILGRALASLPAPSLFGPYLHPQSFTDEAFNQIFADYSVTEPRRYRIGFMGNSGPTHRTEILAECRRAIAHASVDTFWVEYVHDGIQKGLPSEEYISALEQMDFCLCPTGWSRWTHRVIESLCRGSIPILQDRHLYGLSLQNSVHCISVDDNDWHAAVKAALSLSAKAIHEMRQNILNLRNKLLAPSIAARRFCDQF